MNEFELDKDCPNLHFKSAEDVVTMFVFYFIDLAMMRREMRQHIDWTMLGLVDDLVDFIGCDQSNLNFVKTLDSLKGALNEKVAMYKKKLMTNNSPKSYNLY